MMGNEKLKDYRERYKAELLDNCLNFWERFGLDEEHGGIYTCLDRYGKLYNTDKSVWFQGRCAWIYAYMCTTYGYNERYKQISESCLRFLDKYCIDDDGRMFFIVTQDGLPLRKRRYFFSETFYIIACAEYAFAFKDESYLEKARRCYDMVMGIYMDPSSDPYKITPKFISQNRPTKAFAEPMILLNVSHIMARCDSKDAEKYSQNAKMLTDQIIRLFYKEDLKALLEMTGVNGEFLSTVTGGRTMNPGHSIESVWFLVTQAQSTKDDALLKKAENIYEWAMERGWDKENGGMLSFVDVLGMPPEALEHEMKLWWPTCETIISSLVLYEQTGQEKYLDNFMMADKYAYEHFSDKTGGEWYGYLRKDGSPTTPACKGNIFKGPFHVPRMLIMAEQILSRLETKNAPENNK